VVCQLGPLLEQARLPRLAVRTQRLGQGRSETGKLKELIMALVVALLPCAVSHWDIIRQAQRSVIGTNGGIVGRPAPTAA
jgi:hypothetical protein